MPSAGVSPGQCLAEALRRRWRIYRKHLRECQSEFSEESVHALRIATRRLISQLILLEDILPATRVRKARQLLKRGLKALGDLRDIQVQRLLVERHTDEFPQLRPVREYLGIWEHRLARAAASRVHGLRIGGMKRWIADEVAELAAGTGRGGGQAWLKRVVLDRTAEAYSEVLKREQEVDPADLRTIHRIRVAYKKFRYMVESLPGAMAGLEQRELRTLGEYQHRMGSIQDLVVMLATLNRAIEGGVQTRALLRPFCHYVEEQRARAVESFFQGADAVAEFWPPRRLKAYCKTLPRSRPASLAPSTKATWQ